MKIAPTTTETLRQQTLQGGDGLALQKGATGGPTSNALDPATVLTAYATGRDQAPRTGAPPQPKALDLLEAAGELKKPEVREGLLAGYHLPEEYTSWFYDRRIYPYLSKPQFEGPRDPEVVYRGMYVSLDELANIIDKGFELSRTSWHAGGDPGVSFSSSATEARNYIFTEPRRIEGVGIVFEVRAGENIDLLPESELHRTKTIYRSEGDVPAEQIVDILVWGRWGCERLSTIIDKIREGTVIPHDQWTDVGGGFGR